MTDRLRLRTGGLDWRVVDDEVVLLDGERSVYMATNASGTLMWEALSEGASREDLIARLTAEYGIERDRAAADVDGFLADLRDRGLLEET